MSRAIKLSFASVIIISMLVVVNILFPLDTVNTRYANISEARADNLFERGWLPDILPSATTDIYCSNELDLNTSKGSFKIASFEYRKFREKVEKYSSGSNLSGGVLHHVERMKKESREVFLYKNSESTWVFGCVAENGICEYVLL